MLQNRYFHKKRRFFTMPELLVSMVILAILITVTVSFLNAGKDTWIFTSNRNIMYGDARVVMDMLNQELSGLVYRNGDDSELATAPMWFELKSIKDTVPGFGMDTSFVADAGQKSLYSMYGGEFVPSIHFIARSAMNDNDNELSVLEYTFLPPRLTHIDTDGNDWPGRLNSDGEPFKGGVLLRKEIAYAKVSEEIIKATSEKNALSTLLDTNTDGREPENMNTERDKRIFNIFAFDNSVLKRQEYDIVIDCVTSFNVIPLKIDGSNYKAFELMELNTDGIGSRLEKPENWTDSTYIEMIDNVFGGKEKPNLVKVEIKILPRSDYKKWLKLKEDLAAIVAGGGTDSSLTKEIENLENTRAKTFSKVITIPVDGGKI